MSVGIVAHTRVYSPDGQPRRAIYSQLQLHTEVVFAKAIWFHRLHHAGAWSKAARFHRLHKAGAWSKAARILQRYITGAWSKAANGYIRNGVYNMCEDFVFGFPLHEA